MRNVLIVEDNPDLRTVITLVLKNDGYNTSTAVNGVEAIKHLNNTPTDIVITDIMMPEMNGFELCERIRQDNEQRQIYLIILTALNSKSNIVRGLESGADDYLTKPFSNSELIARIRVGCRILDQAEHNAKLTSALAESRNVASMSTISASVAHEINSPLGAISFNNLTLEKMFQSRTDDQSVTINEVLRDNQIALKYMTNITNALKKVCSIDNRQNVINCDIEEEIESALVVLSHKIHSGIVVSMKIDPDQQFVVSYTRGGLMQILLNLLSNAIEAIDQKGTIEIGVTSTEESILLTVMNDGPPIDSAFKNRIFDAQFTTKLNVTGTGIGLDICRSIAENNGGWLRLDDRNDNKTCFTLAIVESN